MTPRSLRLLLFACSACALTACSRDDEHGSGPAPSSEVVRITSCAKDPRVTPFSAGVQAKSNSGRFLAEVVSASPSPPRRGAGEAGINTWTMRFTLDQAPVTEPVTAETLMPDHGHASPKTPTVTANADGTHTVGDLFLFMGGVWEITFATGATERATLSICVE